MLIRVTRSHIEQGARCCSQRCMVALAIEDACPGLFWVEVSLLSIRIKRAAGDPVETFVPPPEVCKHILDFDEYRRVEPFQFELPLDLVPANAF